MSQKIILLGEDDANIAEMYKIAFDKAGYNTIIAQNGEIVIKKAKELSPDILLLDINMPIMDGFEVLQKIQADLPLYRALKNTPIAMLTNYNNPQDIEYCVKMGAQDYIVKSEWTPDHILKKIEKLLAK